MHEDTLDPLSKDEYTALLHKKGNVDDDPTSSSLDRGGNSEDGVSTSTSEKPHDVKPTEQLQASIGNTSKKRFVKVIGDHSEVRKDLPNGDRPSTENSNRNRTKRKKIKLSFDEEAET